MTVREIAIAVAELLQSDDIAETLSPSDPAPDTGATDGETQNVAADPMSDPEVRTLVRCVNLAAAELSTDGFPLVREEALEAAGGVVPLSAFSAQPSVVRSVKKNGARVHYTVDSDGLHVACSGTVTVSYSVAPADVGLDGEIELGALADRTTLMFLAARNYCLVTGRMDDASVWDQRYADESGKKRLSRLAALPERVWR